LGFLRTTARLRERFWWAGWYAAVEKQVVDCLAWRLNKMKRSRRQATMQVWHPKARFETIAVDVLAISPTSATVMKKVVVIGDVFLRFMMAIAVPAETAAANAEVLFERWIAVFGPPVRLLSDRGKVFVSEVVQNLFARVGTKKFFTTPYARQTVDGMVECFNGTLCRDLAKFVTHEEDWDRHLAFAVFRYSASCNEATGVSPVCALFGVDPFEFDACLSLELRLEDEPHNVAQRLAEVHGQLCKKAMRSRAAAQVQYDKAVQMRSYAVGDRVLIYHTPGET
jgi:Integrase core domain